MSLLFLILVQFILLINSQSLFASVVLMPSLNQSFESYISDCSKDNYLCTHTVIKEKINSFPTPKYDQFILDLDLQSNRFMTTLSEQIKKIVETEMISLEQLESLINILQRAEEVSSNKYNKILRAELTQFQEMANRAAVAENFNLYIFKKPLKAISNERLKSFSIKPLTKMINFQKETIDQEELPFKTGICTKSQLSEVGQSYFSASSYTFNSENECSWTDSITEIFKTADTGVESKYKLTSKQKNILLWSAVAIGAGLLLSQYELTIEY